MREFYDRNADFKTYVDRYCKQYGLTVEEALEHEIVKQVAVQYKESEDKK